MEIGTLDGFRFIETVPVMTRVEGLPEDCEILECVMFSGHLIVATDEGVYTLELGITDHPVLT